MKSNRGNQWFRQSILAFLGALAPAALWAQTNPAFSAHMGAQHLYCTTYDLVSGPLGIFLGLGLAFFGFVMFLTKGFNRSYLILMVGGVFLTALPGIFESSLSGTSQAINPLGAREFGISKGRAAMYANCDYYKQAQQYGIASIGYIDYTGGQGASTLSEFNTNYTPPSDAGNTNNWRDNVEYVEGIGATENEADFFAALCTRESSCRATVENPLGYSGLFQFGGGLLSDLGYIERCDYNCRTCADSCRDTNLNVRWDSFVWTERANAQGIYSQDDFLSNPQVQLEAMRGAAASNWRTIERLGLDDYIGETIGDRTITAAGLLGAAHLAGAGGLNSFLTSDEVRSDANGTTAANYLYRFSDPAFAAYTP